MIDRNSGRDKALHYLEKNLDAQVADDPDWRYAMLRPYDAVRDLDPETWPSPERKVEVPAIRIRMHPAQFERLLGILSYIVDPELRESLGYRTPQEAAAFEVLQSEVREKRLRDSHPTIRAAYDQYITAIKLCT